MGPMSEMAMPGGWTMSMMWMRMPDQSWFGAAASFLGMWVVMMTAMMLPSLVPVLWRYRRAVGEAHGSRLAGLTATVGAGYLFVWTMIGVALYPIGVALAAIIMRQPELARVVPIAVAVTVLVAGSLQLTAWKARHLACWREGCGFLDSGCAPPRNDRSAWYAGAWNHGLTLGLRCCAGGAGPMAILIVAGIMDLRAMAVVTAALTAERLAPGGERVARATGIVAVAAGLFLIVRAAAAF